MHRAIGVKVSEISIEILSGILNLDISIYMIPEANAVAIDESCQSILFSGRPSECVFWGEREGL